MHKPSIAEAVYNATFPRPKPTDPTSFSVHIARNLVPEVRIETQAFYGLLDSIEAQYPGLDYSVFDELGLTKAEIASLCRWEGTLSARQRYEKEEGIKVRDTTADSVRPATPAPTPSARFHTETEPSTPADGPVTPDECVQDLLPPVTTHQKHEEDGDYSDEEMESYGVQLNQRLMYATAAREQGHNIPLDEDWEQWLKEARERGSYDMMDVVRTGQPLETRSNGPAASMPALMNQLAIAAQQPVSVHPGAGYRRPSTNPSGVAQ
ncbi:conserved hypothetical protein [Talaromyces stipitatus ATCC 10500]|uniref:Uncharacterized protein n=1 Tax=Talaromyces stipitatus (strain ATCC 10500 / CBS 375.48 / QM 6759 / NRRL 1006) TaxID=441959 RepID=B8MGP3_TALSN|nr:uncharacterized protein TSTA_018610 [Talaromyces stipitatus ATCC 10500]EED16794.1 conserved hypothetical protein [Talaromyces stipitatus ATCC 10500]